MRSPSYPMVPKVGVAVLDGGHSSLTGSRLEAAQFQPFYELQLENISLCCSNLTKVADDAFVYAGEIDNTLQFKLKQVFAAKNCCPYTILQLQ